MAQRQAEPTAHQIGLDSPLALRHHRCHTPVLGLDVVRPVPVHHLDAVLARDGVDQQPTVLIQNAMQKSRTRESAS